MCMEINYDFLPRQIISDLALNAQFSRGQDNTVSNCWHFSTDGNSVDEMFCDEEDFRHGMNRIYVIGKRFKLVILAFCLMDTHVHFVLYGSFRECNLFMHEYVRLTSSYMSNKYGVANKFADISISHQNVDTDNYLKTVICYTIKNPVAAGMPYPLLGYPWSSGSLYFAKYGYWMSPSIGSEATHLSNRQIRELLKTHDKISRNVLFIDGMIHPSEYVAIGIVEKIYRTAKSFNWFLCRTKEDDVDARGGIISCLSIPMQEMRQNRNALCQEMFGITGTKSLDTSQRIKLARALKFRYNSSIKQISRLCGLMYDEIKDIL
ncbi:MAG: hypothetical protein KBS73_05585 [Bacteroidales bacterium]|nr:hypothetical protein [Candidatus Cacconaster equifaecalis]